MSKTARQAERANCEECSGTGWRDSGGSHPWGDAVYLPCDMCEPPASVERISFEVHPIAERERQCCGSLVTGPHKMGCDYKMRSTKPRKTKA